MIEKVVILCAVLAGAQQQLPPEIILAVRHVEGATPGAANRNSNGTEDLGEMQINTVWLKDLAGRYRTTETRVRSLLLGDRCFNIQVGAWILRKKINETGDFWAGVAWYNSRTPRLGSRYAARVHAATKSLFGRVGGRNG